MITAHLPAGYITGRVFAVSGPVVWAGVAGGALPDLDLIWFYFVDDRAFHHHNYWVHIPGFWLVVAVVTLLAMHAFKSSWIRPAYAFFAAIFVHLGLDGIAGGVKWAWPFSDQMYYFIDVPARQSHWVLNFVFHPVFLLEIGIWIIAIVLWKRAHSA